MYGVFLFGLGLLPFAAEIIDIINRRYYDPCRAGNTEIQLLHEGIVKKDIEQHRDEEKIQGSAAVAYRPQQRRRAVIDKLEDKADRTYVEILCRISDEAFGNRYAVSKEGPSEKKADAAYRRAEAEQRYY